MYLPAINSRVDETVKIVECNGDNFSTCSKEINDSVAPRRHTNAIGSVCNIIFFIVAVVLDTRRFMEISPSFTVGNRIVNACTNALILFFQKNRDLIKSISTSIHLILLLHGSDWKRNNKQGLYAGFVFQLTIGQFVLPSPCRAKAKGCFDGAMSGVCDVCNSSTLLFRLVIQSRCCLSKDFLDFER